MKNLVVAGVAAVLLGCSQEQREDAIERVSSAAKELNGAERTTPVIVAEARRKEKRRQDTQWTKENQALHPVEYCQAQLAELEKMAKSLQVQAHSIATAKAAATRRMADAEAQMAGLAKLLQSAKAAYRAADVSNQWPVVVNGYRLSKEKAQGKIVDVAERIASLKSSAERWRVALVTMEKKAMRLDSEQRKLVVIRERVQTTLDDLKTKQVVDGVNGISDALGAISDSMASLGTQVGDPALDDFVLPDPATERVKKFEEIMSDR